MPSDQRSAQQLTVAVDTLDLRLLVAGAAAPAVVGRARLQADQQPGVAARLVAGHGLHQVGAVGRAARRLVHDLPLPHLEACRQKTRRRSVSRASLRPAGFQLYGYITFYAALYAHYAT